MNKHYLIALFVALCIAGGYFFIAHNNVAEAPVLQTPTGTTTVPVVGDDQIETESDLIVLPFGETILKVGESAAFEPFVVKVVKITGDSRCPTDVTCVQAGTVTVDVEAITSAGTVESNLEIGEKFNVRDYQILFKAVEPQRVEGAHIPTSAYNFTFEVTMREKSAVIDLPESITPAPYDDGCYVGGCSAQFCTENPALVSTCEYKEEYACYQKADCARQQTGECGWTESAELNACLMNAGVTRI